MDAVRSELVTGQATGRRSHITKARETIRGLQNWLRRNSDASPADRAVAQDLIDQLKDALRGP
jgi:hypothetical protein